MSPLLLVAVGFGGALGALCRSKATGFLKARTHGNFPAATLIINICSCTLAGMGCVFSTGVISMGVPAAIAPYRGTSTMEALGRAVSPTISAGVTSKICANNSTVFI